jgi:hypothetical protein
MTVSPPDNDNRIDVDAYSVSNPDLTCAQVLKPFEATVGLGDLSAGKYVVWINDGKAGEFSLP